MKINSPINAKIKWLISYFEKTIKIWYMIGIPRKAQKESSVKSDDILILSLPVNVDEENNTHVHNR